MVILIDDFAKEGGAVLTIGLILPKFSNFRFRIFSNFIKVKGVLIYVIINVLIHIGKGLGVFIRGRSREQ